MNHFSAAALTSPVCSGPKLLFNNRIMVMGRHSLTISITPAVHVVENNNLSGSVPQARLFLIDRSSVATAGTRGISDNIACQWDSRHQTRTRDSPSTPMRETSRAP